MDLPFIHLKPAIYSASQTIEQIIEKVKAYPEQRMNTDEALDGKTIEFILFDGPDFGQPPGSLSEWYKISKDHVIFKVSTRDGDDIVIEGNKEIPIKFIIIPEQKNIK